MRYYNDWLILYNIHCATFPLSGQPIKLANRWKIGGTNSPHGGSYISKEIIRKEKLEIKLNKTTGQNIYGLAISL